jgi:hypothetical protein
VTCARKSHPARLSRGNTCAGPVRPAPHPEARTRERTPGGIQDHRSPGQLNRQPYRPEREKLINITKESGVSRACAAETRRKAMDSYRGKRYLDWDLPDPAGPTVEHVRPIRDEIAGRVRALLGELDR